MATFPGSYVPIDAHTNTRINYIVDNMITPRALSFRQITVYDERAEHMGGDTWKLTYPNWNEAYDPRCMLNSNQQVTPASIDHNLGSVTLSTSYNDGDVLNVTYNIDWFPVGVLAGFLYQAVDIINNSGQSSSATTYTINTAPSNWDGVLADIVFAMCMEKLLLDYDLWYGRLIFAIGANQTNEGDGGDVISQIETLKQNAEERAQIALDNERFKIGNLLAKPTSTYYAAVRGIGGSRGSCGYGKLRGWHPNRYI